MFSSLLNLGFQHNRGIILCTSLWHFAFSKRCITRGLKIMKEVVYLFIPPFEGNILRLLMVRFSRFCPIFDCNYEFVVTLVRNLEPLRAAFQFILPDLPPPAWARVIIFRSAISRGGESAGAVEKRKASLHRGGSLSFSPFLSLRLHRGQQIRQFWTWVTPLVASPSVSINILNYINSTQPLA